MFTYFRNHSVFVSVFRFMLALVFALSGMLIVAQPGQAQLSSYVTCVTTPASPPLQTEIVIVCTVTGNSLPTTDYWPIRSDATGTPRTTVYYVKNADFTVPVGLTLSIEGGVIVKVDAPYPLLPTARYRITVLGNLELYGTSAKPVIFTSSRDDEVGGNTDKLGNQSTPGPGDWEGVILSNRTTDLQYVTMRYARYGLQVKNTGGVAIAPAIHNNLFWKNFCGLTLTVDNSQAIDAVVSANTFRENHFGFCTTQVSVSDAGKMSPVLDSNLFENNIQLPIYLSGSAFPTYTNNVIKGYDATGQGVLERHLAIGLGGAVYGTGTWQHVLGVNGKVMPYVVVSPLEIRLDAEITVLEGTHIMFYTRNEMPVDPTVVPDSNILTEELPGITVTGMLNLPDPGDPDNPVIFTSYHDDTIDGDINGATIAAKAGDWFQVYFKDTKPATDTTNFIFQNLKFRYGFNGLYYQVMSYEAINNTSINREPVFDNIEFYGNVNGLRLKAFANNSVSTADSRLFPKISNCTFQLNGRNPIEASASDDYRVEHGVPIFLDNSVFLEPEFNSRNNQFIDNLHPAIGVAGSWRYTTTWMSIRGQGMDQMPYLVHGLVTIGSTNKKDMQGIDNDVILTIPAGTVVKFNVYTYYRKYQSSILAAGELNLQSIAGSYPIVFSSIYDHDPQYIDISADLPTAASRFDWYDVDARHPNSKFNNVVVRYAGNGLHLHDMGTYPMAIPVTDSEFSENNYGLLLDLEGSGDISGEITNNIFTHNNYGLVTYALEKKAPTGISKPTLDNNIFEYHDELPIYLHGSASPIYVMGDDGVTNNTFHDNKHPAIGLGGYFGSNDDYYFIPRVRGDSNAPFNGQTFPYAIWDNTTFDWATNTNMAGGLVVKAKKSFFLKFYGALSMDTSDAAGNQNVFTAFYDDSYGGNTDAYDSTIPTPSRTYWDGVYLFNPNTIDFSYTTVRWANYGLVLFQDSLSLGQLAPDLFKNTYDNNYYGLTLWIESAFDIIPTVSESTFRSNTYGLYTHSNPDKVHFGISEPFLTDNVFNGHDKFPIYLDGTSDPVYSGNTFTGSFNKGIAVSGYWATDDPVDEANPTSTWQRVPGDDGVFPYVVVDDLYIELTQTAPDLIYTTVKLLGNTLIKVVDAKHIYSYGKIIFDTSVSATHEVFFTSYKDDTKYPGFGGGDTNADGTKSSPKRESWGSVWLIDFPGKYHTIHNTISKYAVDAFTIFYSGIDGGANIITRIEHSKMQEVHNGVALVIGWDKEGSAYPYGKGNIYAVLDDILVENSDYGIITTAHNKSTGIARPTLSNITFKNIAFYPVFLGGTSEPDFASNNVVTADPDFEQQWIENAADPNFIVEAPAAEMELKGLDRPGNLSGQLVPALDDPASAPALQATEPETNNALTAAFSYQQLAPAVALGGAWNNTVVLPNLGQIPYAVVGNFPVQFKINGIPFTPAADVTIGEEAPVGSSFISVGIQPGTIFKFAASRKMTVLAKGDLSMTSTLSSPAIFTSMKDDSVGGDTNRDGPLSKAIRGDWAGVVISTQKPKNGMVYGFSFHDAILRYSTVGLHMLNTDAISTVVTAEVYNTTFMNNAVGITLETQKSSNIDAYIHNNRFATNGSHISGQPTQSSYAGRLFVKAENNNLEGTNLQTGIYNGNTNGTNDPNNNTCVPSAWICDFDATNNYWGAQSGPYHTSLNATGKGTTVSDRVKFKPFLTGAVPYPSSWAIRGRVTNVAFPYAPIQGVKIKVMPLGIETMTSADGTYSFVNVDEGSYTITAYKGGMMFTPAQQQRELYMDATDVNFTGTASTTALSVSAQSMFVKRPSGAPLTITLQIKLSNSNNTGAPIKVSWTTVDDTAIAGTDYVAKSGEVTFNSGDRIKTITVTINPGSATDPEVSFIIQPTVTSGDAVDGAVGIITIGQTKPNFVPMILN